MEVYSPKKFSTAGPNDRNEYSAKKEGRNPDPEKNARSVPREKVRDTEDAELPASWVKRVFYERMKAFFEYEEVS